MPAVNNIPGLPEATAVDGTEKTWVVQNGRDVSMTTEQIASLGGGGGGGGNVPANLTPVNGTLIANGTAAIKVAAPGTAGQVLTSNGAGAAPTYQPAPAGTVAGGGTGQSNLAPVGGLLVANGVNPINITAVGTAGQVLTSNGVGVPPTMQDAAASSGTVPQGGTGRSTLTAHGVLIGEGVSAVNITTAGTAGQVLTSNGAAADPTFQAVPTPTIDVPHGGTGLVSITTHGLVVGQGVSPVATVAPGTTGQVLTSNGAAADPTMQTLAVTVPQGGTGAATFTAHGVLIGEGVAAVAVAAPGSAGQVLTSNGAGADPSMQAIPTPSIDVPHGGTGVATLTNHGVVIGQGVLPAHVTSAGTAGQVLTSNGASLDPTFQAAGGGGAGLGGIVAVPLGAVDCTASLQASVNAAVAAGVAGGTNIMYMPAGTYTVTPAANGSAPFGLTTALLIAGAITIIADVNAHVIATVAAYPDNTSLVDIQASNVSITGGIWDFLGNNISGANLLLAFQSLTGGGAVGTPYSNISITNATMQNCGMAAGLRDCNSVVFQGNKCLANNYGDYTCYSNNFAIAHHYIRDNYFAGMPAISFASINFLLNDATKDITDIEITGNHVVGWPTPGTVNSSNTLIQILTQNASPPALPATNVVISNNVLSGGSYLISAAEQNNLTCCNNSMFGGLGYGIEASGWHCTYTANVIEGNGTLLNGMTVTGGFQHVLNSNRIRNFVAYGICVEGADHAIVGNNIWNAVASNFIALRALSPPQTLDNATIVGNMLNMGSTASEGIIVDEASNVVVGLNNIVGSSSAVSGVHIIANGGNGGGTRDYITVQGNQCVGITAANKLVITGTTFGVNMNFDPIGIGIGFGVGGIGVGGTVTQATNKSTTVVLNKLVGTITMNNASLANITPVTFTFTNSFIAAGDYLDIKHVSAGTIGPYVVTANEGAGSASVTVYQSSGGALSQAIVLKFAVIKSQTT